MQTEQQTIQFAHEYAQALAMVVVENLINKESESIKDGNKIRANTIKECIEQIRLGFNLDK
jgi:hypothetical protein